MAIGRLERFVADWEAGHYGKNRESLDKAETKRAESDIEKRRDKGNIAVVGSGPGGLTVAGDLARMGYRVVIFEAFHKPGGVLVYGIPEFRLPKAIVGREIEYVKSLGVEIKTDYVIGRILTIDDLLKDEFDGI